jgi:hypothetical protein
LRSFNMNECVWVKLTLSGEKKLLEFQQKFLPPNSVPARGRKVDGEGRTCFQLHDFMHIFGQHLVLGQEDLFDSFSIWFEGDDNDSRRDYVFRMLGAKLVGYNVQHADEFVQALRSLMVSPQRETIVRVVQAAAKML